MRKLLAIILSICLCAGVGSAFAEEDLNYDFTVGFSCMGNYNNFWIVANESIVQACEDKGVELH